MVKNSIIPTMDAWERGLFEGECARHPWLADVKMSDEDFCSAIDRDLGEGVAENVFSRKWRDHYSWVFVNVVKYFYEHGVHKHFDEKYMDSQAEYLITLIMRVHGANWDVVRDVLANKARFVFESEENNFVERSL